MTVEELIKELSFYSPDAEVRIVSRREGWDAPIMMISDETYGLDPETQVGIFES